MAPGLLCAYAASVLVADYVWGARGAYGGLVESSPDEDFDLTLKIDLDNLNGKPEDLVKSVSELKRNLMGGLFTRYFDALCDGKAESLGSLTVDYRSTESMYIIPGDDRVVVVYSVDFSDATDRAVAGVHVRLPLVIS